MQANSNKLIHTVDISAQSIFYLTKKNQQDNADKMSFTCFDLPKKLNLCALDEVSRSSLLPCEFQNIRRETKTQKIQLYSIQVQQQQTNPTFKLAQKLQKKAGY